jgi:hypothetical protein
MIRKGGIDRNEMPLTQAMKQKNIRWEDVYSGI